MEKKSLHKILDRKLQQNVPLGNIGLVKKILLKLISVKWGVMLWTGF